MASSLKIGLVLDDGLDKPDGVQQYILAIGEWLRTEGHNVHYLVGQTRRTDLINVHSMSRNIAVRFNGNGMTIPLPTNKRKLKKFLKTEKFDVLHVQTPYSPFMGHRLIMAAGPNTAIIGTFHIAPQTGIVTLGTKLLGLWLRRSLRRFDYMCSVSPAAQRFARQTFGVDTDVLPNVVDYERFYAAQPRFHTGKPTILFLGRLVPRKGCLLLLQAIHELQQRPVANSFRVLVCGRGPDLPALHKYIEAHNLSDMVEMVGFVSEADKPDYYASADIAVFPSNGGESFGIVLLEAMASGRAAVLAGDNPGYRSVMESQSDLLFDPRDSVELADCLEKYMTDARARQAMSAWGAEYTKAFDIPIVGQQLTTIYEEMLQNKRQV